MSDPFIAEIRMVGFTFPPRGWADCNGQLLSIAQNTALFSLVGTTFGGDGRTTFGLPALRGRTPVGVGTGAGLSPVSWGERSGDDTVALGVAHLPPHNHAMKATNQLAQDTTPSSDSLPGREFVRRFRNAGTEVNMHSSVIGNTGGGLGHENIQPSLAVRFVIALVGTYPSRN